MISGQIKEATCSATVCEEKIMQFLNTCIIYQINTSIRQLCLLAQAGHKSGGLFYTDAVASGGAYEEIVFITSKMAPFNIHHSKIYKYV